MHETPQHNTPQELARQLANVARVGVIHDVRHTAPARCRVAVGGNITDWLPWFAIHAGGTAGAQWWAPEKGEQCMLLAVGGDMGQGVVLPGIYSDANPQPSERADARRTQWNEKDFQQHTPEELATHHENAIRIGVGEGCSILMQPDRITLTAGGATLQIGPDDITANVDVIAGGISLMTHLHTRVVQGFSLSGEPTGGADIGGGVLP